MVDKIEPQLNFSFESTLDQIFYGLVRGRALDNVISMYFQYSFFFSLEKTATFHFLSVAALREDYWMDSSAIRLM